jgi:hypothetical protein
MLDSFWEAVADEIELQVVLEPHLHPGRTSMKPVVCQIIVLPRGSDVPGAHFSKLTCRSC